MEYLGEILNLSEYGYLRVAAVSPKLKIGNVEYNVDEIIKSLETLEFESVQIAVFPELSLTGYTCADLFYQNALLDNVILGLDKLVEQSKRINVLFIVGLPLRVDAKLFNCAAVIGFGKVYGIIHKTYIPNTREFYEARWFFNRPRSEILKILGEEVPFGNNLIFVDKKCNEIAFGVEICHDLWAVEPISTFLALNGARVIFNLSASDEWIGKCDYRHNLVLNQSARINCGYVYSGSSACESTTDMVFSGHCIIAENGRLLAEIRDFSFETTYIIADIDLELIEKVVTINDTFIPTRISSPRYINVDVPQLHTNRFFRNISPYPFIPSETQARDKVCREVFNIQSTGLARRLLHTNLKKVVLGLSGGLDSTLALLVSLKAFEKLGYSYDGIYAVLMPGFGTSRRTFNLSKELAKSFGVSIKIVDIRKSVALHLKEIGASSAVNSLVFENAQARERTQILMDLANHLGGIVVGTGDLSEIALGWSTYNADHMSMYNVNATVPKTLIRFIIDWVALNHYDKHVQKVLQSILELPSSPELLDNKGDRPHQITEEIVGPFDLNDFFLYYSNRYAFSPKKILFLASLAFKEKYSVEVIKKWLQNYYRRFFVNQFKRSSMPDGPKVGYVDLSPRGSWRMPSDADFALWISEIENL